MPSIFDITISEEVTKMLLAFPWFAAVVTEHHQVVAANEFALSIEGEKWMQDGEDGCLFLERGCDHPRGECNLSRAFSSSQVVSFQYFDRMDLRWYDLCYLPLSGSTSPKLLLCLIRDITDRIENEEHLRETVTELKTLNHLLQLSQSAASPEELLQSVIDSVVQVPWLGLERKVGAFLAEGERLRLVAYRNFSPQIISRCHTVSFGTCLCGEVARTGRAFKCSGMVEEHTIHYPGMADHGHIVLPIKYGEDLLGVFNFYLAPGQDLEETGLRFLNAVTNLTGVNLKRMLLQSHLAQSERLSTIGLLAAGVAHEINNPLTYILNNIDEILHSLADKGEPEAPQTSHTIEGATDPLTHIRLLAQESRVGIQRIKEIVSDLKVFSATKDERTKRLSVQKVLESTIAMAYNEFKYRATLIRNYEEVPVVIGSEGKLAQVFLNLLINAAHALEETHGKENRITIGIRSVEQQVVITIEDTGCGIPARELPRIFNAFYTTKPHGKGTGLGLSISAGIVRSMGGVLTVRSTEGVGTCFTVRLPASSGEVERSTGEMIALGGEELHVRGTILVVDDDPLIQKTLQRSLSRFHMVIVAQSGEAAIRVLSARDDVDLIVSDLMMANISGEQLHQWVHDHQPGLLPRMVFTTGGAFTPQAAAFLERPEIIWMEKPFRIKELLAVIQRLLAPEAT